MPVLSTLLALLAVSGLIPDYLSIQHAYHEGLLTGPEYAQTLVQAMTEPSSLADNFIGQQQGRGVCLTTLVMEAKDAVRHEPGADAPFRPLYRPQMQHSFVSPYGLFTIHYDTSGGNTVYQPTVDENPADGIPDYVNRCAEIFDYVWHVEIDTLGFDPPGADYGLGGSDNYDVYLVSYQGAYGVTWPEGPAAEYPDRNAVYSHIFVDPTYTGFGYTDRLLPLKVTAAHEFHHAVQFSYTSSAGAAQRAWMEHCAVWMEDVVYDQINDYLFYLSSFFNAPHKALYAFDGLFPYGACVWPHFLDHRFGRDILRRIWVENINTGAQQAVDNALQLWGSSRDEAVAEFRIWNYFTGDRDDGQHYEEGSTWPKARIMADHFELPVLDGEPLTDQAPGGLACNYIRFSNFGDLAALRAHFEREDAWSNWAVNFLSTGPDLQEILPMELTDHQGTAVVGLEGVSMVVMIPTCLATFSGDYSYWARDASELLVLEDVLAADDLGDNDGRLEKEETFHLGATFWSIAAEWDSTQIVVRSLDPSLTVVESLAVGGGVAPGGTLVFPAETMQLTVVSVLDPHKATVRLLIGQAGQEPEVTFDVDLMLGTPPILLVDDDNGEDLESYLTASLDSLTALYDLYDNHEGGFPLLPSADLEPEVYEAVIWFTGDAGSSLDSADVARATFILENGVHLLLTGQDIAEDLSTWAEGRNFMETWLGVDYLGIETRHGVLGPDEEPLYGGLRFGTSGIGMDGANNQTSQDQLQPRPDVTVCLEYQSGETAAVRRSWDSQRLIFCGFGVEAVVDDHQNLSTRRDFLEIALDYLINGIVAGPRPPLPEEMAVLEIWPNPVGNILNARLSSTFDLESVEVNLVDMAGREVVRLLGRPAAHDMGKMTIEMPPSVPTGFYLVRFTSHGQAVTTPVTVIR